MSNHAWANVRKMLRLALQCLISPLRLVRSLRRSLTPASVTLLLFGIVSTNIIWGYPWIGAFAACLSMFVVGWIMNRACLPELQSSLRVPRSIPAGTSFWMVQVLENQGWLPAMKLQVELSPDRTGKWIERSSTEIPPGRAVGRSLHSIPVGESVELARQLSCQRRGIQALPDAVVTSYFPFYLFRCSRPLASETQIAITPRLLTGQEDPLAAEFIEALGAWSRRLLCGDARDYTGSREYQVGMSVRRWDFSSWARLGRPVVREYQSPSVRSVNILVDTSVDPPNVDTASEVDSRIERVLSMAATVVDRVRGHSVHIRMFVTGENRSLDTEGAADLEDDLIRLAASGQVSPMTANRCLQDWIDQIGHQPSLLVSAREQPLMDLQASPQLSILTLAGDGENCSGDRSPVVSSPPFTRSV